jgi:plastocyanin
MSTHAAGISIVSFVVAAGVSIAYYQYVYIPEVNARPILPDEIVDPPESVMVSIVEGSYIETQERNFVPRDVRASLGVDNRIIWQNDDEIAHTVTSEDYVDAFYGPFDSMDTIGVIGPGDTYEFIFTEEGQYPYFCIPHPWMTGSVQIVESFA